MQENFFKCIFEEKVKYRHFYLNVLYKYCCVLEKAGF